MKKTEIPYHIAALLLEELPEKSRNVSECEKILNDSLKILKGVTLNNLETR